MSTLLLNFAGAMLLLLVFLIYRVYCLKSQRPRSHPERRHQPAKTMIVLGSGGHTTEMMTIVRELNHKWYSPRTYVLAASDINSAAKIKDFERDQDAVNVVRIVRSRSVNQSYVTSVWSTIRSAIVCVPLIYKQRPDLILCNGPGTCVPVCMVAYIFKIFYINQRCRIVFVESFCRVHTISLSGKLLKWIADLFVVQWPQLGQYTPNTQYVGRIM